MNHTMWFVKFLQWFVASLAQGLYHCVLCWAYDFVIVYILESPCLHGVNLPLKSIAHFEFVGLRPSDLFLLADIDTEEYFHRFLSCSTCSTTYVLGIWLGRVHVPDASLITSHICQRNTSCQFLGRSADVRHWVESVLGYILFGHVVSFFILLIIIDLSSWHFL